MDEAERIYPPDSELDLSFTSCASTTTTFTSSSARSSLNLSFNESRLSAASAGLRLRGPHRRSDPLWSAISAAAALSSDGILHLRHLKLVRRLGSGNLGRVFLCHLCDNDHANFALKVVDKNSLTPKKLSHVMTEGKILSVLDHPFLPTLYARIEVSHYICFLIDYCPNGDLHSLLKKQSGCRLSVDSVRFFAAEVLVALEYLHSLGIVYRDLKPENILIRQDGHIMLSDFDLSFTADVSVKLESRAHQTGPTSRCRSYGCYRRPRSETTVTEFMAEPTTAFSKSCVGTHEYLAPELVSGNGHGAGVDWWAFGVLLYELLFGTTPFKGTNKECTLLNIASTKGVRFRDDPLEARWMAQAKDLIEKLLVKDPRRRLGSVRGATDIKRHPFFRGIKWPLILAYRPPEVSGLAVVKRSKAAHASQGSGLSSALLSPPRRRRWWKGLFRYLRRYRGSKYSLNSNQNYYCHTQSKAILASADWACFPFFEEALSRNSHFFLLPLIPRRKNQLSGNNGRRSDSVGFLAKRVRDEDKDRAGFERHRVRVQRGGSEQQKPASPQDEPGSQENPRSDPQRQARLRVSRCGPLHR